MTHTLHFDKSIQQDARDALKLMMNLFEANYSAVNEIHASHVRQYVDEPTMRFGPATPQSLAHMNTIRHDFEFICGDRCVDPFTAISTFLIRLTNYASRKKFGSQLAYRCRAEISMEMSFECGHEWYGVTSRLVIIGDDNLPETAND